METVSVFISFLKMIFALAIVLGLLIGVMYFVKKVMQNSGPSSDNQGLINIISSKYLGPKNKIVLIEISNQLLVVGISGQQMTTLSCIDDPLIVAQIKARGKASGIGHSSGNKLAKYVTLFNLTQNKPKDKIER